MSKVSGSCLCGEVTFECDDDFQHFHLCHCIQCQKTTGSAHASNLFTSPGNINWLSGADSIKRYDVPGRAISKAFCTECGCGVPYLSGSGLALVVPVGSLDSQASIQPQSNIFCVEKAPWFEASKLAPEFQDFPG